MHLPSFSNGEAYVSDEAAYVKRATTRLRIVKRSHGLTRNGRDVDSRAMDEIPWRWRYTNEFGKRVESFWHMYGEQAAHYKDAEKIEDALEVRRPLSSTADFIRSPKKS